MGRNVQSSVWVTVKPLEFPWLSPYQCEPSEFIGEQSQCQRGGGQRLRSRMARMAMQLCTIPQRDMAEGPGQESGGLCSGQSASIY